jgi:C-1 hydroxylase
MVDENKALTREFFERFASQDYDGVVRMLAADFRASFGEAQLDAERYLELMRTFFVAFPDLRHEIDELLAEGDRVAGRLSWQATHHGRFLGIPPTGRAVSWTSFMTGRLADQKFAELRFVGDLLRVVGQLGALPPAIKYG